MYGQLFFGHNLNRINITNWSKVSSNLSYDTSVLVPYINRHRT